MSSSDVSAGDGSVSLEVDGSTADGSEEQGSAPLVSDQHYRVAFIRHIPLDLGSTLYHFPHPSLHPFTRSLVHSSDSCLNPVQLLPSSNVGTVRAVQRCQAKMADPTYTPTRRPPSTSV